MSGAAGDPYLDLASGVLRNLLGITDVAELTRTEAVLSASRLIDLERRRLPGRYDLAHLQAFRRYILGDVYDMNGNGSAELPGTERPDQRLFVSCAVAACTRVRQSGTGRQCEHVAMGKAARAG